MHCSSVWRKCKIVHFAATKDHFLTRLSKLVGLSSAQVKVKVVGAFVVTIENSVNPEPQPISLFCSFITIVALAVSPKM